MDRIKTMAQFVRVAELGSFAAVAQQMGVARSVVTRQIAALETHLGCKLLTRSTRRLSLTSEGLAYLDKCRVILDLVESAESAIAAESHSPRGHIRISLPLSYGVKRIAPLLLDFASCNPEISLDMDYSDRRMNLIEEGFDLSIRITQKLAEGDIARKLGSSKMLLCASADYLAKHGAPKTPNELSHHEFLGYTLAGSSSVPFIVDGVVLNIPMHSRIDASNGEVLAEAAVRGLGMICHPDFVVEEYLEDGRLQQVLADQVMPELGIYAILPSNRHVPHRVRVLLEFLVKNLE